MLPYEIRIVCVIWAGCEHTRVIGIPVVFEMLRV